MKLFRRSLIAALLTGLSASCAFALEVLLDNGKHFTGEVTLSSHFVNVKVGPIIYQIPRGSVKTVRLAGLELAECAALKAKAAGSADGSYEFARWLDSKYQNAEAVPYYEEAIRINPDHAGAREALGYRREKTGWVLSEEDRLIIRTNWLGKEAAEASYQLAVLYRKAGQEKKVEPALRRALIADYMHPGALRMLRPITDKYVSKNKYRLPIDETWVVLGDGSGEGLNHHSHKAFMAYAFDFMKVDAQRSLTRVNNPKTVEDFYTWGAPIYAAADGEVQAISDGFTDLPLGQSGEFWDANTVCLKHAGGEYTVYGHLMKGSFVVKKGQKVKAGDMLAKVGNSGSSGAPHLHFAMYDRDGIGLPCTFINYVEATPDGDKAVPSSPLREGIIVRNTFAAKPEKRGK